MGRFAYARGGKKISALAALTFVACLASVEESAAAFILQIELISPTQAILTGSGTLPPDSAACGGNCHILSLMDPFASDPGPLDNNTALGPGSTLQVNSRVLNFAYTAGSNYWGTPVLYIGDLFTLTLPAGGAFTGQMPLLLTDSTFAPVGSTGIAYWGSPDFGAVADGTWQIVGPTAVPEPATMLLLGTGLLGAGVRRWRQKRA